MEKCLTVLLDTAFEYNLLGNSIVSAKLKYNPKTDMDKMVMMHHNLSNKKGLCITFKNLGIVGSPPVSVQGKSIQDIEQYVETINNYIEKLSVKLSVN